jgi:DNA-binding MarR family transcriptional regulator
VAVHLGINRTDLRCLEILIEGEVFAPGLLGKKLGLTSGSVTAMLDRLEKLDYVARSPDPADRRRVAVRITAEASRKVWAIYGPIAEEGSESLARYTAPQLLLVIDYLHRCQQLYQAHLARVRNLPSARKATPSATASGAPRNSDA